MSEMAKLLGVPGMRVSQSTERLQAVSSQAHQLALARQMLDGPEWFGRVIAAAPKDRPAILEERLPGIEVGPVLDQLAVWDLPGAREQFAAQIDERRRHVAAAETALGEAVAAVEADPDVTDDDLADWADLAAAMNSLVDVDLMSVLTERAPKLRGRSLAARERRVEKMKGKSDE